MKKLIILNTIVCFSFAIGLYFFVPAVSPKIDERITTRMDQNEDTYYCEFSIRPLTKYTYIVSVDYTVEYYTLGVWTALTENRVERPINNKFSWTKDKSEFLEENINVSLLPTDFRVKINKVVCNNGADLRRGIIFLLISVICLGIMLKLIFKQKREKAIKNNG